MKRMLCIFMFCLCFIFVSCKDFNKKCHAILDQPIMNLADDLVNRFECNPEAVKKDLASIPNTLCGKGQEMKPHEYGNITCRMIADAVVESILLMGTERWQCKKKITAEGLRFITNSLCTFIPMEDIKSLNN